MTSNHSISGRADALADDTTFDESGFVLDDDASFDGDQLDRAERAALRRALLDPLDHRPWLDVAAAREGQGALAGALQALAHASTLDGGAALAARAQRERVRLRLN